MGSLTGTSSLGLRRYLGSRYCTKTRFPASSADSIHPSHYCPVEPAQLARKHGTKSMGWWLWHRLWPCRGVEALGGSSPCKDKCLLLAPRPRRAEKPFMAPCEPYCPMLTAENKGQASGGNPGSTAKTMHLASAPGVEIRHCGQRRVGLRAASGLPAPPCLR